MIEGKQYMKQKLQLFLIYLGLSILFILPFIHGRLVMGWDMIFHLRRVNELSENIERLNFHPYIYTFDFKSIGFPAGIFYPDITLLPFALFKLIFGSFVRTVLVGIGFYSFLTLIFTHWVVYKITKNSIWSFFTAVLYTFSTYRIIDAWTRFALGEFIALTFTPLVLYGLYSIIVSNYHDWPFLSFGLSLTLFSHVLSTYIEAIFCLVVGILSLKVMFDHHFKDRILAAFKALIVFIGSSSIFIFPFLEQELSGKFAQPAPMKVGFYASPVFNVFKSMLNNNLLGNYNSGGEEAFTIGFIGLIIIIIGGITIQSFSNFDKIVYLTSVLLILLPTTLIPWTAMNDITWINVIQFPFRELGIAALTVSYLGGREVISLLPKLNSYGRKSLTVFVMIVIFVPWYSSILNLQSSVPNENNESILRLMSSNEYSTLNLDNYTPKKGIKSLNRVSSEHLGEVGSSKHRFNQYQCSPNSIKYYGLNIKQGKKVVIPFYNMKNIHLIVNGKQQRYTTDKHDLIQFIATKKVTNIKVKFIPSTFDNLGVVLTLVVWYSLALKLIKKHYRKFNAFEIANKQ